MPTTNRPAASAGGAAPTLDAAWLRARIDAGRRPSRRPEPGTALRSLGQSVRALTSRTAATPPPPADLSATITARGGRAAPLRRQLRDLGIVAVLTVAFLHPFVPAALAAVTAFLYGPTR